MVLLALQMIFKGIILMTTKSIKIDTVET